MAETPTRIVVPTEGKGGIEGKVATHFGRCDTYTFLDSAGNLIEVIKNTSKHMGGTGLPPELMKEHGADVLLCKGLGMKAFNRCKELGIDVYVCQADTAKEIFNKWKNCSLNKANPDDTCRHKH